MISITNYELKVNKKGEKHVVSLEECPCPFCSGRLSHKDFRLRIVRWDNEGKEYVIIRVLYCAQCNTSHRELPDFLVPHKHYAAEVIEAVIDEEPMACNGADESTVRRWIAWFKRIKAYLNAALAAIAAAFEKIRLSALEPLDTLREAGAGWLTGTIRRYVNSGGTLSEIT